MVDSSRFWTRAGGVGGIVFFVSLVVLIALMPLTHSAPEPAFDAPSSAFLSYAKSEANVPLALSLVGVLGLFGFAVFAVVLSHRFRVVDDRSNVPSTLVLLTAGIFIVLWLIELGLATAQMFRRADLDATGASIFFGLSNGIFVVSWSAIAACLAASGFGAISTRALPPWLGWSAVGIGIGMLLASAAPLSAIWFFPYFLFFIWVLATSVVVLIRQPISSPGS
jgi:hypothetical protein